MNYKTSEFKFLDRNKNETLVLIPGWATDTQIFNCLNLGFNYLLPSIMDPYTLGEKLNNFLHKAQLNKISLFGYSMGGFVAADFANAYPEKVQNLILVGIRKKYNIDGLNEVRRYLKKNKAGYLYKFYQACFAKDEEETSLWFNKTFFKQYKTTFGLDFLFKGLDYLAQAELIVPNKVKTTLIHGTADIIAPIAEASAIKKANPHIDLIAIDNTGHMPFLRPDFKGYLAGAQ